MPTPKPAFVVFGVPVYMPASSYFGLALLAWFALPAGQALAGSSWLVWPIAFLHGAAVYLAVFAHEFGHVFAGRFVGYPSPGIVVHFWGGHTTFAKQFSRPMHQFFIAVAGPLATLLVGGLGWLGFRFADGLPGSLCGWLAWAGIVMAVVNLLPGAPLDGGAALAAVVWAITKSPNKGRLAAGVAGLLVAAAWMTSPWWLAAVFDFGVDAVDILIAAMVGAYLAANAWAMILTARLQGASAMTTSDFSAPPALMPQSLEQESSLPDTPPVRQIARRAVAVAAGTSCADALSLAQAETAGAIVVTRDDEVVGIVRNSALAAVPSSERERLPIDQTARRIGPADRISGDLQVGQIGQWLQSPAADEWLVVDAADRVYGVLIRADVLAAVGQGG